MIKTWFITGASKGFGREWAIAALERGDNVVATARRVADLDTLVADYGPRVLALQLDVTRRAEVFSSVDQAKRHFGSLDIVVNNAGYGQFGMVEELTESDVREQMETNFFGTLWVTQASLPIMRSQGSGHIIQNTSEGGITAFPGIGAYHASKWAVEGMSQSLAQEVSGLGIHVTLVEPGPFATDWLAVGARQTDPLPAYEGVRAASASSFESIELGTPAATRTAILAIVDAEIPPLRVFLGKSALAGVEADYESRLATWHQWQTISILAAG